MIPCTATRAGVSLTVVARGVARLSTRPPARPSGRDHPVGQGSPCHEFMWNITL